jgi:hypothetical protein
MIVARVLAAIALVCAANSVAAAQAPPQRRDTPAAAVTATGRITGVVVSATAEKKPIRRARVVLGGAPNGRVEITDDRGRFVFDRLPVGNYTINVSKAAYLPSVFGAHQLGRPGTSIALGDKQSVDVSIALTPGAVVTGAVRDARGRPMPGIDVGVVPVPTAAQPKPSMTARPVQTDDRGEYRLFGVPPGEYYIAAVPLSLFATGVAGRRTVEENDAIFALLQQRVQEIVAAPDVAAATAAKAELPLGPATAFAPVIYPGVTRIDSATTVTLSAGEERTGIDFAMTAVRVGAIEGTISGALRNLDRVELSLMFEGAQFPTASSNRPLLSHPPDKEGRFRYDNVLPGRFVILARALAGDGDPKAAEPIAGSGFASGAGSSFGRNGPVAGGDDYIHGRTEVEVDNGVVATTSIGLAPGSTLSGTAVFDASEQPPPGDMTAIKLRVDPIENISVNVSNNTMIGNPFQFGPTTPFAVDGTWRVRGVPPGKFLLRPQWPAAMTKDWWLRSAITGERDLLDGPIELQPGQDLNGIQFTFTNKHSELSGTLTTSAGRAAADYFIIVMPSDPKLWTNGSRRVKSLRPASDGAFDVKDLPAGDYLIAALADVAPGDWNDSAWLAQVAPAGVKVAITDGGKTVQDLRIGGAS